MKNYPSLRIPEEEIGRFLLAYYRGVFPSTYHLGAAFLFYYGLMGYNRIRNEVDDDRAAEMIKEEFTGILE